MRKILTLIFCLISCQLGADPQDMARAILKQIIHDPVNANSEITDDLADKVVVVALRGAVISIACKQKYNSLPARYTNCLNANKSKILTIGVLSNPSFNAGNQAAESQLVAHPEVSLGNYSLVINLLLGYIDNLSRNAKVKVPLE